MVVTTLCGSTKFKEAFLETEAALTFNGHIVLSVGFFEQSDGLHLTEEKVMMLGQMHFKKIDRSDEIFVVDVNGYIGESTSKEIEYARKQGKRIRYYSKEIERL
ncbi:hypothetical protein JCM19046_1571 [Bacillus sp. JCM 19046]|nr:hypothetical protein JCM19045_153 [Bacillus sp. JCM 19045]GAF17092.1 hypothetical protein JCM19046_1571 [Bacillus sp. JCM 19046]